MAALLGEVGGDFVFTRLRGARMSAANFAECLSRVVERGGRIGAVEAIVRSYEITLIPFGAEHARIAAELREPTRHLGLSLGDRACLALARDLSIAVLTADHRLSQADVELVIEMIR